MLEVSNLNYASASTVAFQRLSVIATDLALALGVRTCWHGVARAKGRGRRFWSFFGLIFRQVRIWSGHPMV